MSQNIQSLWSPDIKATVMSPSTILRGQAEALALQTGGVLLAEVRSEELDENETAILFDLVAPALQGSRHRILRVSHAHGLPYPAWVEAEVFENLPYSRKYARSDLAFTQVVAEVLNSPPVLSVAQSLVARANEALAETAPA